MAYVWLSELLMPQDIFPRKMLNITNEKKNRIMPDLKEDFIAKSSHPQLTKIKDLKEGKDFL